MKIFGGSIRIFKDLHEDVWGSSWQRILMKTFEKSTRMFTILVKIFKDLSFSYQYLQRSRTFLPRLSRILHFLSKIFKDLLFSCLDLWGSFRDLEGSSKDPTEHASPICCFVFRSSASRLLGFHFYSTSLIIMITSAVTWEMYWNNLLI